MPLDCAHVPMNAPQSAAAARDQDIALLLASGATDAAFDLIAARYAPKVYRLCLAMLRAPAAADEAAQDSLLRAWRALSGYRPQSGALSTWLYAITRNRCLTLLGRTELPTA